MLYVDLFESNAIAMFAYDLDTQHLFIHFKTGGVYAYQAVPRAVFDAFRAAPSKGQFFRGTIRDRYAARRLSPAEVAAIERLQAQGGAAGLPDRARLDIAALQRLWKAGVFF